MTEFMVTEKDNNAMLHLHVGDDIKVSLETFPGTGYSWIMAGEIKGVLSPTGETLEQADEKMLGGAEQQVFSFRVESTGEQTLRYEYRRPWEKTGPAMKEFVIQVMSEK